MYPSPQQKITHDEIVDSDERVLSRSYDALQRTWEMLATKPDLFLGRRNLIEPAPIEFLH